MLRDSTLKIIRALDVKGGCNVQFALDPHSFRYYVIEVNPRASRSVLFLSKSTGFPLVQIATRVMLGQTPAKQGIRELSPNRADRWYVKTPAFSFSKLTGMDAYLSPEMKSTWRSHRL